MNKQKISFLNNIIYCFVNYSHISLYQKVSENIPYINYLIAFNWALIQAILTYHFFPEILRFIATSFTISSSFQISILAIAVSATFVTIFLVGLSVWNNKKKNDNNLVASINNILERENSFLVSFSLILILLVTHALAYGYISEWANQIMLLFPLHPSISFIICGFAIINLLFFSIERCVSSLDYLVKQPSLFSVNNIFMFLSIHVFMFGVLGIFNLSSLVIYLSGVSFVLCYYLKNHDSKKSIIDNLDDILNDWIFLIMHAVSEGAVVGAGIYLSLSSFITNPTILIYLTGIAIAASTVCEEMEDLVHHDCDEDLENFAPENASVKGLAGILYNAGFGVNSLNKLGYKELDSKIFNRELDQDQKDLTYLSFCLSAKNLKKLGFNNSDIIKLRKYTQSELLAAGVLEGDLATEGYYYPLLANKFISFNMAMCLLFISATSVFNIYALIIGNAIAAIALIFFIINDPNSHNYLRFDSIKFSLEYLLKKVGSNIIYFTCMVTALCVGINGGLEFFHIFGTNINVVLIIAIAGLVVESLVYHDQISSQEEHEHGSLRLFSFLTDFNNLMLIATLTIVSYSFLNLLFFIPGITSYGVYSTAFMVLSIFGKEIYANLNDFITYNKSKDLLLLTFTAFCLTGIILNIFCSFYVGLAAIMHVYLVCSPFVFIAILTGIPVVVEYFSVHKIHVSHNNFHVNSSNIVVSNVVDDEPKHPTRDHSDSSNGTESGDILYCVDVNDPSAMANFLLFNSKGNRIYSQNVMGCDPDCADCVIKRELSICR